MPVGGSTGGIYRSPVDPKGYAIDIVRWWKDLGERRIAGNELYREIVKQAKPVQVEMGIGNVCGLQCQHCFLGYESGSLRQELTTIDRLKQTTTELVEQLGTRQVCLTDRDALTPGRSIPFFEHLAQLRLQYQDLKFGGVTNGLRLPDFVEDLQRINLDYLDISIDGIGSAHDRMRGAGQFDKVLCNLRLALNYEVAKRIVVTTTVSRANEEEALYLIAPLIQEGVQWFDINPLMAVKMQDYQLQARDMADFLESLVNGLKLISVLQPVNIVLELRAYNLPFIPALIDRGWLVPEMLRQDCYGNLYQDIELNNGITITLRPSLLHEYWRNLLRITADGYVVGGCEALTRQEYEKFAVGNIQEESIQTIYRRALEDENPLHYMFQAYDQSVCRDKPCFKHCLGGDSLLAKAMYGDYRYKDPNCVWDSYSYVHTPSKAASANELLENVKNS